MTEQDKRMGTGGKRRSTVGGSILMLVLVAAIAYVNAWPDALVLDDSAFAGSHPIHTLESMSEAFQRGVWRKSGDQSTLYRPLMLIQMELERQLFGGWKQGYHLVNILLHVIVTLMLYGFLRQVLRMYRAGRDPVDLFALLAALVFAVHPVHAEVVNSVFNGSSMMVSLFGIGGLWFLLRQLETRAALAWLVFGLAYSAAMLFKEEGVVLPGIAVALIMLLTEGGFWTRVKRFLPVFWLLIPLFLYFWIRVNALAPGDAIVVAADASEIFSEFATEQSRLGGAERLYYVLATLGYSIKVILWPYPLRLFYPWPSETASVFFAMLNVVLIVIALFRLRKGQVGMAVGLAWFYIAMLPASRVLNIGGSLPHVAERYLYFPSVGLSLTLAFAFRYWVARFGRRVVLGLTLVILVLFTLITLNRNADWGASVHLFETEYSRGNQNVETVRLAIASNFNEKLYKRVTEICDEQQWFQVRSYAHGEICAVSYLKTGNPEEAEATFRRMKQNEETWRMAAQSHAVVLVMQKRHREAAEQFIEIIEGSEEPEMKAYYRAEMLITLYPTNIEKLQLARQYLEEALRLDPEIKNAKKRVEDVDKGIAELLEEPAEEPSGEPAGEVTEETGTGS